MTEKPSDDSVLPPGRRDPSGFWLPEDCDDAQSLVRRRRGARGRGNRARDPEPPDES